MKEVSLCIVSYNNSDGVKAAIDSVRPLIKDVVIVDQGSSSDESIKLKSLADVYMKTTNKGNADYDRQYCYALARSEYILAMDSDEVIETEEVVKLQTLINKYDFDVVWFLFQNFIKFQTFKVDLHDLLHDDPHPRLWKKRFGVNGSSVETMQWPHEAHRFPNINSPNQIFSQLKFNHTRELEIVLKTHIRRKNVVDGQAQQVEKNFIKAVMKKFDKEVVETVELHIPELKEYLRN